ncbi:ESX secretion-associated protein EspG [Prauserella endophytica]|uniref:ESX secretion-associated protein EspG n=1 Tax=Prauserella endophytica TaxID=1592324 RepID=A0ABY2S8G9_9PSEU|nr:ESX secretion-associated protein EspG [Prauserella endophytica]TKG72185.1 ESX secretion-associated protein EspG [Prauserella endophytica]
MSERFEFVLGSVEASIVGQALGVDVRRFPLRVRNTTTDPARLIKLAKLVTGELAKRRLIVGNALHTHVRTAFGLFGDHRLSVAITGIDGLGEHITVLAFTDGAQALGITQRGDDELFFSLFSDDELVDVLAGVLPAAQAAPGAPATVRSSMIEHKSALAARRAAEREHDEEETDAFGNISIISMVEPPPERNRGGESDERRLRRVLAGERHGGGQITVVGHDGTPPHSISWLDAEAGRYLVHTTDDGGEFVARYEPAGYHDVVRAIRDAVSRAY